MHHVPLGAGLWTSWRSSAHITRGCLTDIGDRLCWPFVVTDTITRKWRRCGRKLDFWAGENIYTHTRAHTHAHTYTCTHIHLCMHAHPAKQLENLIINIHKYIHILPNTHAAPRPTCVGDVNSHDCSAKCTATSEWYCSHATSLASGQVLPRHRKPEKGEKNLRFIT